VVFGKGGIGKSTVSANLAAAYALQGLKVLLVGCDPKHDTTVALTDGLPIRTVVERSAFMDNQPTRAADLVVTGRLGVDCIEAGGPDPGIGCAGRGISRMIEILEQAGLFGEGRYDVALFDVLGDVVCGGFAAPLRQSLADRVCVVLSEELMALYAANNIARAIRNYASNGAALCGLIANLRDPGADRAVIGRFAGILGTRVLAFMPRDPRLRQAEYACRTIFEAEPESEFSRAIADLAPRLLEFDPRSVPVPTPMTDETFHRLARSGFLGASSPMDPPDKRPIESVSPSPLPLRARRPVVPNDDRLEHELKARRSAERGPNAEQWGAAEQWRNFFCDPETRRNARTRLELRAPTVYLAHQDLECSFSTPQFSDEHVSFFNFPWQRHALKRPEENLEKRPRESQGAPIEPERQEGVREGRRRGGMTDLRETDVIHGGGAKLEAALDALAADAEGLEAIIVHTTCVPTVIGDDAAAVVQRRRDSLSVPIFLHSPSSNREADPAKVLFEKIQSECSPRRDDKLVNLVGFPEGAGLEELRRLLEDSGLAVNACVMPDMTMDAARRYRASGVQVLYPNIAYENVYQEIFRPLDLRTISPDAPYGWAGTRRWVLEVAGCLGLAARAEAACDRAQARLEADWRDECERAAGGRLAFIADAFQVERLVDPALFWGVPAVAALKEMGFGLDILFFGPPGKEPSALSCFETPAELERRLKEGTFQAAYSEFFFDDRLTRAGKAQFSLLFFEPGFAGALRSARRLNALCRWPFYRRYGRYLEAA
jgi:nitrogenase iron protein